MSKSNLWKRKARTILTVLGVVIGVAAYCCYDFAGTWTKSFSMEQYESYGSLTQIQVNAPYEMGGNSDTEVKRLNDSLVEELSKMEHVESVYPIIQVSALAVYGGYEGYLNIQGMPVVALAEMGIEIGEGSLPGREDDTLKFFYGANTLQDFYNAKTGSSYWETGELPDIDLMKDPIFIIFDMDTYYQSMGGGTDSNGQSVKPPKKYLIETCGVEAMPESGWSNYGWYTYCDIEKLIPQLQKIFKNKVIPGQPSTKTGKPYKEIFYSQLLVNVDNMDYVTEVQTQITDMGYEAYSNAEWVESEQRTLGYIQAVLGGIGAVSLLVAAIGITNTMMMSIYERTKEIGIMKVLGCDLRNIRTLFLMEAGFIGFIGGVIGLILSYTISFVINRL